tara:strand:- start:287 stop:655 length:369 start_codon:yes stop_codon:yes gene_type:complete
VAGKWGKGPYGGRNKRQTRNRRTGKKFELQDRKVRKHGPNNKRTVFAEAIEWALSSYFAEGEWLTSSQIAEAANKKVPPKWTQLNGYSVGAFMRICEKNGEVLTTKKNNIKHWKLIKPISKI